MTTSPGLRALRIVVGVVVSSLAIASVLTVVEALPSLSTSNETPSSPLAATAYAVTVLTLALAGMVTVTHHTARALRAAPLVACAASWSSLVPLVAPETPSTLRLIAAAVAAILPAAVLHLTVSLRRGVGRSHEAESRAALTAIVGIPLAYLALGGLGLARSVVTNPFLDPGCRTTCTSDALLLLADPATSRALGTVAVAIGVLVAAISVAVALTTARHSATHGIAYRSVIAACIVAVIETSWLLLPDSRPIIGAPPDASSLLFLARCTSWTVLASIFIWTVRQQMRRDAALDRALRVFSSGADPSDLRTALATALRDPDLRVAYRLPNRSGWFDESGAALPASDTGSASATISRHGEVIARVTLGRQSFAPTDIETAVGAAARLAIDNERMRSAAREQIAQLRASRQRIIETSDGARRASERDLHDGAQQRLLAASYELRQAIVAAQAVGDGAAPTLGRALDEVLTVLAALREIAQGIYPPVLIDNGLVPALESLARSTPARLIIDAPSLPRLPPVAELTAYLAVREAVARPGTAVSIALTHLQGAPLRIDIRPAPDYRLVDLADRVGAIGGSIRREQDRIVVEVPCE